MHCNVGLARLRLMGKYSPEDLDAAYDELRRKGKIARCHQHPGCVRLAPGL